MTSDMDPRGLLSSPLRRTAPARTPTVSSVQAETGMARARHRIFLRRIARIWLHPRVACVWLLAEHPHLPSSTEGRPHARFRLQSLRSAPLLRELPLSPLRYGGRNGARAAGPDGARSRPAHRT